MTSKADMVLPIEIQNPISELVNIKPNYYTPLGAAYLGDSLNLLKTIPDSSINLIMASPPYALVFKKEYGNVDAEKYVE